jgi:hypothetical protein
VARGVDGTPSASVSVLAALRLGEDDGGLDPVDAHPFVDGEQGAGGVADGPGAGARDAAELVGIEDPSVADEEGHVVVDGRLPVVPQSLARRQEDELLDREGVGLAEGADRGAP